MCLGVPGKVLEVYRAENCAVAETFGVRQRVDITLVDEDILPGDYLMVHAGCAIGKIDAEDALISLELLEEILDAG